jgi:hypothetical protein
MKKEHESVKEVMRVLVEPCMDCVHEKEKPDSPACWPCLHRTANNFKKVTNSQKIFDGPDPLSGGRQKGFAPVKSIKDCEKIKCPHIKNCDNIFNGKVQANCKI